MKNCNLKNLLILSLLALISCTASEEERIERRENAFNLEGQWSTALTNNHSATTSLSYFPTRLNIINESGDRSDIKVEVSRSGWSAEELSFFRSLDLSLYDFRELDQKFNGSFSIGRGRGNILAGGENISKDFGATSSVYLSSNKEESLKLTSGVEIEYFLDAKIKRNENILHGNIIVRVTKMRERANADGIVSTYYESLGSLRVAFNAKKVDTNYISYLGLWIGESSLEGFIAGNSIEKQSQIDVREFNNEKFYIEPIERVIYLFGEVYYYESDFLNFHNLMTERASIVAWSYLSSRGNRITFEGVMNSKRNFSGRIDWVISNNVETIGSFTYMKK